MLSDTRRVAERPILGERPPAAAPPVTGSASDVDTDDRRSGDPSRPGMHRYVRRSLLAIAGAHVVVGVIWWLLNLTAVPAYGDTPEYVRLAQTLDVDGYRTLAYPALVRISLELSTATGVPWQLPLYLGQTAASVLALWYFVRTVAPRASRASVALVTAVTATTPLVLHYATTVLSDSVAAALFVVALSGAARMAVHGDTRWRTVLLTGGSAVGTALMRAEKPVVLVAVAVAFVGIALVTRRRGPGAVPARARIRSVVPPAGLFLVAALVATVVNGATQAGDHGRPDAGLVTAAMSRIVWPHVAEIRDDLPEPVRDAISPADAATFDQNVNSILALTNLLRELDGGGDAYTGAAIRAALRCCAPTVALQAGGDAVELAVAPLTFAGEASRAILAEGPVEGPTVWNLTRMDAAHPALTHVWVGLSSLVLLLVVVGGGLAVGRARGTTRRPGWSGGHTSTVVLLVWAGVVVNGCFFAAVGGGDANVRYGVSSGMVVVGVLAVLCLARARAERTDGTPGAPARR
jgi:hypothetical protein